jgi:sulfatase maturation enzyme AslB (radical SAM superfamily)
MVAIAISAFLDGGCAPPNGVVVTAVLPGGCPLGCPFCVVASRGERKIVSAITPDHFTALLESLAELGELGGVAIVGDEPLQSASWPFVAAILSRGEQLDVPQALITSGYYLEYYVPNLVHFSKTEIIVSVDAVGERHDAIRRKSGVFSRIRRGLELASRHSDLQSRITIGTILMPSNLADIEDVIGFAGSMSVSRMTLSPLLLAAPNAPLRVHPKIQANGWKIVPGLKRLADERGVNLFLSDDFSRLDEWATRLRDVGILIKAPAGRSRLIRVDASGRIATYEDIKRGTNCGLALPPNIADMAPVASKIASLMNVELAAAA